MTGLAALPMYDFPEIREATDNFWAAIASEIGVGAPQSLTRSNDIFSIWKDPDLVFAQTCGLPYVQHLSEAVQIIGTPDYGIFPEQPGWYNSVIIVSNNDPRQTLEDMHGARFAFNGRGSQSGLYAPLFLIRERLGEILFFGEMVESGSHEKSAEMVAGGAAEIAAIDAVTWRFLQRYRPFTSNLRILEQTVATPGLPIICSNSVDSKRVADAVEAAIKKLARDSYNALGLKGFWRSGPSDYQIILQRADAVSNMLKLQGVSA